MSLGLVGRKVGMTRISMDDGDLVPVTAFGVGDSRVTQIKMDETDGYTVVQITSDTRRASHVTKPLAGHLAKADVGVGEVIKEFRVDAVRAAEFQPGANISIDLLEVGQKIDAQGVTIGKGYAGIIKRYNFSSGRASHGNSRSYNASGPIGMTQDPGRVLPGKRTIGRMGDVTCTIQNLEIAKIDTERKLLLIKGAIPGAEGGQAIATPAVKARVKRA